MPTSYRIAVMADIHGNLPAFEAVMAELERYAPLDGVLVAGDIITGPGQASILQRLMDFRAVMVQGNNEKAAARLVAGQAPDYFYTAKQFSVLRWACQHLDPGQMDFIRRLPEQQIFELEGADPIRIMHGSPKDVYEGIVPAGCVKLLENTLKTLKGFSIRQPAEIFKLVPEPLLIFGHTHIPWQERLDGRLAMNPGAVNFPGDGFVGAQYALLVWDGSRWTPEFHAVPYDLHALRRSNEDSGFLSTGPLAKIWLDELVCGRDIMADFFGLANRLAQEAGVEDLPYIPDAIWEQAGKVFETDPAPGNTPGL